MSVFYAYGPPQQHSTGPVTSNYLLAQSSDKRELNHDLVMIEAGRAAFQEIQVCL